MSTTAIAEAQLAANRANAQLSTGPKTAEGKQVSSHNALRTGLTGRTVLLPAEDADRYEKHIEHYRKLWRPAGEHELNLVQALADTWWRLLRIPALEAALYARGRNQFADLDPNLIDLETWLAYEKQFRNLALQEHRLHRYAAKLTTELEEVQKKRNKQEAEDYEVAAIRYQEAQEKGEAYDPEEDGFEFSTADLESYLYACGAAFDAADRLPNRPVNRPVRTNAAPDTAASTSPR